MLAAFVLFAALSPAMSNDLRLPTGWRVPTDSELNDDWRANDAGRFTAVAGDFNGDGVTDKAMLLVSRHSLVFGLFVFLSQADGTFRTHRLGGAKELSTLRSMGIAKVLPGKYESACGKGYWKCKTGEAAAVSIEGDAIEYFKTESAELVLGQAHREL